MRPRLLYALWLCALLLGTVSPTSAQEGLDPELFGGGPSLEDPDDPSGPSEPPRIVMTVGGGVGLRIVQNETFFQDRLAPIYADGFFGFVFGTAADWRHGIGAGIATNVSQDGAIDEGDDQIAILSQWVASASYLGYLRLSDDAVFMLKVSPQLAFQPELSPGLEATGGIAYLLTSGLGLYAEAGAAVFIGGKESPADTTQSIHPFLSAEAGLFIDYEVLP